MKAIILAILFGWFGVFLVAAEDPATSCSRSIFELGTSFTIGDDSAGNNVGYGVCYKTCRYLHPSESSSTYVGILSGYFLHSAGGVDIADTKPLTFGWRGLVVPWLGLDVSLSPAIGARIYENTLDGTAYFGVCPAVGLFVPLSSAVDLALSYEPVFNVYTFEGNPGARNKSYSDIVLMVELESYSRQARVSDDRPW